MCCITLCVTKLIKIVIAFVVLASFSMYSVFILRWILVTIDSFNTEPDV